MVERRTNTKVHGHSSSKVSGCEKGVPVRVLPSNNFHESESHHDEARLVNTEGVCKILAIEQFQLTQIRKLSAFPKPVLLSDSFMPRWRLTDIESYIETLQP